MEIKMICNKCGKEAPIDKKKSTKYWLVYDTEKSCECGGSWKFVVSSEKRNV